VDNSKALTHISLCAGYGGIDLGLRRALGAVRTVAFSEIEAFACENLVAKMEASRLDAAPIWTDLKTFPWVQFCGKVDILSGGFPCQPFSTAGRRAGDDDPRHLWPSIVRGIRELAHPPLVFFENVEGIISSKLKSDGWADPVGTPVLLHVLRELERLGYQAAAGVFSAREIGAPHQRKRVFIMGVRSDLSDTGRALVSEMLSATERGDVANTCDNSRNSQGTSLHSTGGAVERAGASLQSERDAQDADSEYAGRCTATERGDVGNGPRWGIQCSCGRGRPKQKRPQVQDRESSTAYPAPRGAKQYGWEPPRVTVGNAVCTNKGSSGRVFGALSEPTREGSADRPTRADNYDQRGIHREAQPSMGGDADGASSWMGYAELCESVDNRTDELRLLGNGVVPATAERAFRVLWDKIK
jgi:DNA (cytosine-5)-methyltransferase 1